MKFIELQTAFETEIGLLDNNIEKPVTADIEYWLMAGLDKFIKLDTQVLITSVQHLNRIRKELMIFVHL